MPKRINPIQRDPDLPGKIRNALGGKATKGPRNYRPQPDKGEGKVRLTPVRKKKPKKANVGTQKGDWRKVGNLWKQRRFTIQQRRTFRSRDHVFGGPDSGRPNR